MLHPRAFISPATVVLSASAVVFSAGCTSVKRDVATAYSPDYVLTKSQYEQVDVTGSRLPVLMPTAGTVTPLPTMSPMTVLSAESFRAAMMPGRGPARR